MQITKELEKMTCVGRVSGHGMTPIPQEGEYCIVKNSDQISGFSHGTGTCSLKQGACKLTLNVKSGVIQEVLIEVIGCSGMSQSSSMAVEIMPGLTALEALNTDLVCDAINMAMRELFLNLAYGRSQSSFTKGGLAVGAGLEDLGPGARSQVGTSYGTIQKGPRYLEQTEGYVTKMALDEQDRVIGYEYVNIGGMMAHIRNGVDANEALKKATGVYGRYDQAARVIDPRKE